MGKQKRVSSVFFSGVIGMFCGLLIACNSQTEKKENPPPGREQAMERASAWLRGMQREDGAICDKENPLFDVWETIEAALALRMAFPLDSGECIPRALAFLKENENDQGLICHNRKCRAAWCVETTAEYFLLLDRCDAEQNWHSRLEAFRQLRHPDGHWPVGNPDVREQPDFPSPTAFALNAILRLDTNTAGLDSSVSWLLSQQNAEGHWGNAWEYYGCPAYAIWVAAEALVQAEAKNLSPGLSVALNLLQKYVRSTQQENGSWYFPQPDGRKGPSAELQTAFMLTALQAGRPEEGDNAVEHGIQFLLSRQKEDGSWDGGFFPIAGERYVKKETVFCTARVLQVLAVDKIIKKGRE